MRRLNVNAAHLNTCVEMSMYAVPGKGKPQMERGELLLFQLNKMDAIQRGIEHCRTDFALVYDYIAEDPNAIKQLWPDAPSEWKWLLYGSATIPTISFSLDDLNLSKSYSAPGMTNPAPIIKPEDEEKIGHYILGSLAEIPNLMFQRIPIPQVIQEFRKQQILSAIYNHDRIVRLRAKSRGATNQEKCKPNPYLAEILASYYEHRCQICGKDCSLSFDFYGVYGAAFFETHYIQNLTQGGLDISENIVVLCPDHHRIIQATDARFDYHNLAFEYPNGRREPLILRDHFESVKRLDAVFNPVN